MSLNNPSPDMWDKILITFKDALSKAESTYIRKATSSSFLLLPFILLTRLCEQASTARRRRTKLLSRYSANDLGWDYERKWTNKRSNRFSSSNSNSSSRKSSAMMMLVFRESGNRRMISIRFSRRLKNS